MPNLLETEVATISQLDSDRFGVRAARANLLPGILPRLLEFCIAEKIDLLIARCATQEIALVQQAEADGFRLMDTLVYYAFDFSKNEVPEASADVLIRASDPEDKDRIRAIAGAAFRGYRGHYHADPRLEVSKCDEAYASWAERSVTKLAADHVLVAEKGPALAGFATLRKNSTEEVEGLLYAVAPEYQKSGVGPALMVESLRWSRFSQGARRMIISTQVTNVPMQKIWCRLGFEPSHSYYTFHKWFDR